MIYKGRCGSQKTQKKQILSQLFLSFLFSLSLLSNSGFLCSFSSSSSSSSSFGCRVVLVVSLSFGA